MGVIGPTPLAAVLQPLVQGEAVEGEEDRHEDAVDESGRAIVGDGDTDPHGGGDRLPGRNTCDAAEPERRPVHRAARLVDRLHQPAEQDHGDVRPGDRKQRTGVVDANHRGDQHDHERRRCCVLDPADPIASGPQLARIERKPERCDEEVSDGGEEQEAGGADGEWVRERLDHFAVGEWGSRRPVGGEGGDREGEVVADEQHEPTRDQVKHTHDEVEPSQAVDPIVGNHRRIKGLGDAGHARIYVRQRATGCVPPARRIGRGRIRP